MKKRLQVPSGARDLLPDELKQQTAVVEKCMGVLADRGYAPVMTPTIEMVDTLAQGMSRRFLDQSFKFLDAEGQLSMLRADMTTPIARMVASSGGDAGQTIRYSYYANVFRMNRGANGQSSEFYQLGAELIGPRAPKADTDIVLLVLDVLKATGLPHFAVDIGSTVIFQKLLDGCEIPADVQAELNRALQSQNFVQFQQILDARKIPASGKKILKDIRTLRGGVEVIKVAKSLFPSNTRDDLKSLEDLDRGVRADRKGFNLFYDLALVKDPEYYTGMVFDIYTDRIGDLLGGGGRYDNLVGRFGTDRPATGFSIRVDRLVNALRVK